MALTDLDTSTNLFRIRLALAREAGHPQISDRVRYTIVAPLDADGRLDAAAWRLNQNACRVVRRQDDEEVQTGRLLHRGRGWVIDYDPNRDDDDERGFRLDHHVFKAGEYVSIAERAAMHTYRIVSVERL